MPGRADEWLARSRLSVALVAGCFVAFSMPPWGWWLLAVIGFAGLEAALGERPDRRSAALIGFLFALPWMFIGMAWMWFLTPPGYIVVSLLFAGLHAGAAAVAPTGRWRLIGRPAAHVVAEIIRMMVPFGGVPLATVAMSQVSGPFLASARIGGGILLMWMAIQFGTTLVVPALTFLRTWNDGRSDVRFEVPSVSRWALGAVGLVVVVSAVAPSGRDLGPLDTRVVAAVQGGGEQGTSALDVPSAAVTEAHLDATRTIAARRDVAPVDVVVWPENGIDVNRMPFEESEAFAAIVEQVDRLGVPFLVGVTLDSEFSAHPTPDRFVNAQYVIDTNGEVTDGYEKVRIVPFGEYVPLRGALEAVGAPIDQIPADAIPGRDPAVVELPDGTPVGVMISWEVFFGDRGRAAADGAFLINPTNGASYTGTIVQSQQVASSRMRAVETGRWVVQVAPTGYSAFVSADGDVFQRTAISEQIVIERTVPLREGTTWYTALGDPPWIVAVLTVLAVSLWRARGDHADLPQSPSDPAA